MEELTRTEVAQPALFAVSMAMTELAREAGVQADYVAGHSLGEYTAAVAAGCLSAADGIVLVSERGRRMEEIQSQRPGAMGAVIGLPAEQVEELCETARAAGIVAPANLNTPKQIVVSGEEDAVEKLLELAEAGRRGKGDPPARRSGVPQRADGAGPERAGRDDGGPRMAGPQPAAGLERVRAGGGQRGGSPRGAHRADHEPGAVGRLRTARCSTPA